MLPLRDNVPARTSPVVTVGLFVANALVWFWELRTPGVAVHVFRDGFYPCAVEGPCARGVHPLLPALWFPGVWIGLQIWSSGVSFLHPEAGGGVAFFAHVGGFAFGVATVLLVAKRRPQAPRSRYPTW